MQILNTLVRLLLLLYELNYPGLDLRLLLFGLLLVDYCLHHVRRVLDSEG